ncbi:hypothetical protein D9M69_721670 [compost metagenome]
MTPRMFIISATPPISGHLRMSAITSASKSAPATSRPGAEGTLDGAKSTVRKGSPAMASVAQRTPAMPLTLPNSCGSQTIVVTPRGNTALA